MVCYGFMVHFSNREYDIVPNLVTLGNIKCKHNRCYTVFGKEQPWPHMGIYMLNHVDILVGGLVAILYFPIYWV